MTITPTPLVPTAAGGTSSAAAGSGDDQDAAAAGFGALLAQLAAVPPVNAGTGTQPDPLAAPVTDADEGTASADGASPAEATALLVATAPVTGEPAVSPAGAAPPVASTARASSSLAETAVRGMTTAPGSLLPTAAVGAPAAPPAGQPPAEVRPRTGPVGTAGAIDPNAVPAPSAEAVTAGQEGAAALEQASSGAFVTTTAGGETPSGQPQPATTNGVPAATGPGPAVASAPGAPAAAEGGPSPLLDQVTPVLSRMVSAGEGSHRMVLRLHPADLGEVQLTVTVRGGSVDVTMAAGHEARELLAGGSHELRAMLDSIGRTAGQITFKDLPGGAQLQQASLGLAAGGQPDAGQAGASYGDPTGNADRDRAGRGGSQRAESGGPREHGGEPDARGPAGMSRVRGDGALDVRI
jgi:flagellar hook-length control protein FliK